MKRKSLRMLAAAFGTALVLTGVAPMSLQAASATVIDASNVRSEASSTSNAVGSAAAGATVTIGDAVTNDAGETWYPVTLSDGTQGYIKSNLLNITDGGQTDNAAAGDGAAASTGDSAAAGDSAATGCSGGRLCGVHDAHKCDDFLRCQYPQRRRDQLHQDRIIDCRNQPGCHRTGKG